MKGVVFTEFIEMVEDKFGFVVVDKIINNSDLPSGGSYTAVGTYEFDEMLSLLMNLSNETNLPVPELLSTFGAHLFTRFYILYPHFFVGKKTTFEFLANIEDYIHVEVLKLYPDAQLPTIETEVSANGKTMKMVYHSVRKLGDLAVGLMRGCSIHFKEDIEIEKMEEVDGGQTVTFWLTKK